MTPWLSSTSWLDFTQLHAECPIFNAEHLFLMDEKEVLTLDDFNALKAAALSPFPLTSWRVRTFRGRFAHYKESCETPSVVTLVTLDAYVQARFCCDRKNAEMVLLEAQPGTAADLKSLLKAHHILARGSDLKFSRLQLTLTSLPRLIKKLQSIQTPELCKQAEEMAASLTAFMDELELKLPALFGDVVERCAARAVAACPDLASWPGVIVETVNLLGATKSSVNRETEEEFWPQSKRELLGGHVNRSAVLSYLAALTSPWYAQSKRGLDSIHKNRRAALKSITSRHYWPPEVIKLTNTPGFLALTDEVFDALTDQWRQLLESKDQWLLVDTGTAKVSPDEALMRRLLDGASAAVVPAGIGAWVSTLSLKFGVYAFKLDQPITEADLEAFQVLFSPFSDGPYKDPQVALQAARAL